MNSKTHSAVAWPQWLRSLTRTLIAYAITRERLGTKSIEEAVSRAMDKVKGAYSSLTAMPQLSWPRCCSA